MLFSRLAEVFNQLEKTSKRLEMFEILSEFLKKSSKHEIDKVIYLCEENLLPSFYGIEMGMADKMAIKAIASASNKSASEIESLYKKLGDLGLVAEKILEKKRIALLKPKAQDITEVYDLLTKIAKTSGEGSVEHKANMLSGLYLNLSPLEAKYVTRFVLGRLRLGIGDPTIMDSLSKALTGDRMKLRKDIERAYNLCSDLGLVGKVLFEKGIPGLKQFKVKLGFPIRMALAERLATSEDIIKKIGKCAVETKYDGLRLQIMKDNEKIEIFSRNHEKMTHMFPDIINGIKNQVKAKTIVIEGEAVAFNEETSELLPFQVTITRKRKYDIEATAKELPLVLFAFDILYLNGKDLTQEPYFKRTKLLENSIKKGFTIRLAEKIITDNPKILEKFFEENIEKGAEGIIAKRLDAEYQAGARNFNWIKLKRSYKGELQDTVDVVIVGYFRGKGLRTKLGIGALLGAVYDKKQDEFRTIAKIGSGLTEENWIKLRKMLDEIKTEAKPKRVDSLIKPDVWISPKYVFTIMADEITKSPMHTCCRHNDDIGFALRFPRIQGWIRDKKPDDATSTYEIEKMFSMQRHVGTKN